LLHTSVAVLCTFVAGGLCLLIVPGARADQPITDWSSWQQYRATVSHPCLTIKPADIERSHQNIQRHPWAREYRDDLIRRATDYAQRFTPEYVDRMIETTTPLSTHFTPCPACRDLHKPYQPHGHWTWSDKHPDQVKCDVCGTVFPNPKYPETVVVNTKWGTPQTFTFAGGKPFAVFGYKTCRPSFSGLIRAHKVLFMVDAARRLAEAYQLDGDERYASTARLVLMRLAAVYPHWLVHSGYGEIADMDPRVASAEINALPADEAVYPPNKPDRKLFTGYWSAGRATGVGQEGTLVKRLAETYDLIARSKALSDSDRRTIEHDLLLESTLLLTADKQINNKAVGNRSGAGMVGIVTAEPALVRFGLDGFHKTIDQWFLPDGGTPESNAYALMALGGVNDFAIATAGYSDPPGYHDSAGARLDQVDLFHQTAYDKAWSALVNGLRGDLVMPDFADCQVHVRIPSAFVDVLVRQYPDRGQYLALLEGLCGQALSKNLTPTIALYQRDPDLADRKSPELTFPDVCLPDLRIGEMRTGATGRDSLLTLSASHWGTHHHLDSLNISYWKNGQELLSDLGYLWDNPNREMTVRTLAHNTVMIDQKDQQRKRGGEVLFFKTSPHVKVMRAKSNAYPNAARYERTCAIIDHGGGKDYVVDFFTVQGGSTQDLIFHGPNENFIGSGTAPSTSNEKLYDLEQIRALGGSATWRLTWQMGDGSTFDAWSLPQSGERAFVGDGWGQRDPYNKDFGAKLPYIVRRCRGGDLKQFVSVFENHPAGEPFVQAVTRRRIAGGVALVVKTLNGTDEIRCGQDFRVTTTTGNRSKRLIDTAGTPQP
jgi:hypothetical protein